MFTVSKTYQIATYESAEDGESAMAHTPGPWAFRPETSAIVGATHHVGENYAYETIGHLSESIFIDASEREANARLIAAAPDLLAALENIISLAERGAKSGNDPEMTDIWLRGDIAAARAAIARATGAA